MAGPTVTQTEFGWYISASAGTGTVSVLGTTSGAQTIKICGMAAGGSATNDIVSVYSSTPAASGSTAGTLAFSGIGSTSGALAAINLAATVRLSGPYVTFAGGTNGVAILYTPSANY